ncbi:parB-like partition protein [Actinobacteria bacterium OV450]|nr:parB-like partition protein [Actinobacteria bacterium OV450]
MADITITHTRAEGTILTGSTKGDGVYEIVSKHGFRWSRQVGIYIRQSIDREAKHWNINAAKTALEAAGHTVTVEINETKRRSFAEAEAAREERAEDRAERFSDRADRASTESGARHQAARDIMRHIPFGQPILVGHHSQRRAERDAERIDSNMRKSIDADKKAGYWSNRAEASERYKEHRQNPQVTLRRLERLRTELRQQERYRDETVAAGRDPGRHVRLIEDLAEEIDFWEKLIAKAEAEDGLKIWGPDDFAPRDFVLSRGDWYQIARVNPKTLSIAWNLRLVPKRVMTLDDATDPHYGLGTHTTDYTHVRARCPEAAMLAFLADGKIPGTKSAAEASAAQPASAIREALAAQPKPKKKRTDPKIPKGVKVECRWSATEATLTWLNGRKQPHKDHAPVTLTAPDGVKFTESVWAKVLQALVTDLLAERGYVGTGRWSGGPSLGITRTIEPAPTAEPEPVSAPEEETEAPPESTEAEGQAPAGQPQPEPEPTPKDLPVWTEQDPTEGEATPEEALAEIEESLAEAKEILAGVEAVLTGSEDAPTEPDKNALTCDFSENTRNHTDRSGVVNSDYPLNNPTEKGSEMTAETTARKLTRSERKAALIADMCANQEPEIERTAELDAAYRAYVDEGIASTDGWYSPLDFQAWVTTLGADLVAAAPAQTPQAAEPEVTETEAPAPAPVDEPEGETVQKPEAVPAETKAPAKKAPAKKTATKKAPVEKAPAAPAAETTVKVKTVQKTIPTDRIDRDPNQPREEFDEAKLKELAGSMQKLGQLQPISVRYIPATRRYTLIAGERRLRAAKMAGLAEMTAVVAHGVAEGDRETLAKQVAENVGRADMTPIEEAKSFKRLEDAEYTIDEIAEMCGKSAAYIGWRIDLLKLCDAAQEALSKGHLPVGMAWYVAKLSCDNQTRFLAKYARGQFPNDRAAEEFVKACLAEEQRRESQGSFFVLVDETPAADGDGGAQDMLPGGHDVSDQERERIMDERGKLTKKIDKLATAGEILSELATADPEELALLLAGTPGGVPGHQLRMDHLQKLIGKVTTNLRKAQAHAEVRSNGIVINPEAAAA